MQIEGQDGSKVKVDGSGALKVEARSSTNEGRCYAGLLDQTLTNDTDTPVLHIHNDGDKPVFIHYELFGFGASASGSGEVKATIELNDEDDYAGGTPSDVVMKNKNTSFGDVLNLKVRQAGTGATLTAGTKTTAVMGGVPSLTLVSSSYVLAPGKGMAVRVKAPSSNTSMNVTIAIRIDQDAEDN